MLDGKAIAMKLDTGASNRGTYVAEVRHRPLARRIDVVEVEIAILAA